LRAVEMMALGVPGVYSDVPTYRAVVDHGVNGFLARSHDDWQTYLALLIEDDGRRAQMGDAARETARAWTIEQRVTLWERAYEQLL
jgi:glycosyltransferase involved in cell wall biosynthesis